MSRTDGAAPVRAGLDSSRGCGESEIRHTIEAGTSLSGAMEKGRISRPSFHRGREIRRTNFGFRKLRAAKHDGSEPELGRIDALPPSDVLRERLEHIGLGELVQNAIEVIGAVPVLVVHEDHAPLS